MHLRLLVAGLLGLTVAPAVRAERVPCEVRHVSADHVYLGCGEADGVAVGDSVPVFRNGARIGTLVVRHVASSTASCRVASGETPRPQDLVLVSGARPAPLSAPEPDVTIADTAPLTSAPPARGRDRARSAPLADLRGSVTLDWRASHDRQYTDLDRSEPTARINLRARHILQTDWAFAAKARVRRLDARSASSGGSADEWRDRIYLLALTNDEHRTYHVGIGRMTSRYVGGSGYVDGVILSRAVSRTWRVGVVGGLQPTWSDAAPREELKKFGAFVAYEGDPSAPTAWRASVAATGEYGDADVSREFLRLSSQMRRGPWFLAPSVEVDVNRGWREARSGGALSVSNVYVTSRYTPTRALSASLTYDGRANVVTLETRSVPDSIFDDATRHGLRSSVRVRLPGQWTLSVGGGLRGREGTGTSRNWNGSVTYAGLLDRRLSISARYQHFDGPLASGANPSVLILNSFRGGHTAGVNAGAYIYDSFGSGTIRNFWARVHGTYETRFGVYVRAEVQHDWGDDIQRDEITGGIGYRF